MFGTLKTGWYIKHFKPSVMSFIGFCLASQGGRTKILKFNFEEKKLDDGALQPRNEG